MMSEASAAPGMFSPRAFIFDWDDTIGSLHQWEVSVAAPRVATYLRQRGYLPRRVDMMMAEYLSDQGGVMTGSQREERAFGSLTAKQRRRVHAILKSPAESNVIPGMPQVVGTLRRLSIPCGIVSNAEITRLERNVLASQMAQSFDVVVSAAALGMPKPDPGSINVALQCMGISPGERDRVVYVGNRLHDVEAAHAAGVRAWLVGFGIPEQRLAPSVRAALAAQGVEYFASTEALRERIETLGTQTRRGAPRRGPTPPAKAAAREDRQL